MQVAPSEGHRWSETNDQQQNQQHLSATRKIGQMCFMVASAFTLLWTPLQLLLVARFAGIESVTADKIMTVYLLPCLNSCINPLIYGLAWKPLRQTFREVSYICVVSLTLCCIAFFFILTFQFWVLIRYVQWRDVNGATSDSRLAYREELRLFLAATEITCQRDSTKQCRICDVSK